jgi:hypothetical protein
MSSYAKVLTAEDAISHIQRCTGSELMIIGIDECLLGDSGFVEQGMDFYKLGLAPVVDSRLYGKVAILSTFLNADRFEKLVDKTTSGRRLVRLVPPVISTTTWKRVLDQLENGNAYRKVATLAFELTHGHARSVNRLVNYLLEASSNGVKEITYQRAVCSSSTRFYSVVVVVRVVVVTVIQRLTCEILGAQRPRRRSKFAAPILMKKTTHT